MKIKPEFGIFIFIGFQPKLGSVLPRTENKKMLASVCVVKHSESSQTGKDMGINLDRLNLFLSHATV